MDEGRDSGESARAITFMGLTYRRAVYLQRRSDTDNKGATQLDRKGASVPDAPTHIIGSTVILRMIPSYDTLHATYVSYLPMYLCTIQGFGVRQECGKS